MPAPFLFSPSLVASPRVPLQLLSKGRICSPRLQTGSAAVAAVAGKEGKNRVSEIVMTHTSATRRSLITSSGLTHEKQRKQWRQEGQAARACLPVCLCVCACHSPSPHMQARVREWHRDPDAREGERKRERMAWQSSSRKIGSLRTRVRL